MFDPYMVLGVPRSATEASIKAAYRNRARSTHPDRGGRSDEFVVVVRAFDVLSDPIARRLFDETGQVREAGARDRRRDVAVILADMFDVAVATALSVGLPLHRVNFIEQMATAVRTQSTEAETGLRKLKLDLDALKALRTRIRRRDGEPNLFVQRIDEQVKAKAEELAAASHRRALLATAQTELANYDSEVELFSALEFEPSAPASDGPRVGERS